MIWFALLLLFVRAVVVGDRKEETSKSQESLCDSQLCDVFSNPINNLTTTRVSSLFFIFDSSNQPQCLLAS